MCNNHKIFVKKKCLGERKCDAITIQNKLHPDKPKLKSSNISHHVASCYQLFIKV